MGEAKVAGAFVRGAQVAQIGGVLGVIAPVGLGPLSLGLPTVVGVALMAALGQGG